MMNRLFIVVVLYRQRWRESPLLPVLEDFCQKGQGSLLLYDNSPLPQTDPFFATRGVHYIHDKKNAGLAVAYNKAIELAGSKHDRLLLLDQDTQLTAAYLAEVRLWPFDESVPVIVPRLFADKRQLSPLLASGYIGRNTLPATPGEHREPVMAVNSGCGISLEYLRGIGGFNEAFPLDFLDHWFFFRLSEEKKGVQVSQEKMAHALSVLNYQNITATRYQSILAGESLFYAKYDRANRRRHHRQLLLRTIKQFIQVKDRQIWKMTWQEYWKMRRERN
ncbi:glycosyl transferase family 2 [Enterococcus sp. AD013-P3]|uniref:glycosyl transferase family 2 n=1 Tax=Enterococcus sp. AD013-P3 TaxID=3411036 RepID=UPI003B93BD9A